MSKKYIPNYFILFAIKYNPQSKVLNNEFHLVIDVSFICVVIYKMPPSKRLAGKNMYSMLDFTYIAIYLKVTKIIMGVLGVRINR